MTDKQKISQTVTLFLTEERLSKILAALTLVKDNDIELRDYLQKSGENIFRW